MLNLLRYFKLRVCRHSLCNSPSVDLATITISSVLFYIWSETGLMVKYGKLILIFAEEYSWNKCKVEPCPFHWIIAEPNRGDSKEPKAWRYEGVLLLNIHVLRSKLPSTWA